MKLPIVTPVPGFTRVEERHTHAGTLDRRRDADRAAGPVVSRANGSSPTDDAGNGGGGLLVGMYGMTEKVAKAVSHDRGDGLDLGGRRIRRCHARWC